MGEPPSLLCGCQEGVREVDEARIYSTLKQVRPGWQACGEQRISSGPRTVKVCAHQYEAVEENSTRSTSSGPVT